MTSDRYVMAVVASAHGVSKRFGPTTALDGVHLTVAAGEIHGLVGRSGAGKSTLVSILTGLLKPDAGRVRFDGVAAPPLPDRASWRDKVACVHQEPMLIPSLTVAENLFLHRQTPGHLINWRRLRRRASELLDGYGVPIKPTRLADELSIEQGQLVEIARALSAGVRFVILDAPTARLDGTAIDRLFASIRALQHNGGTFLYVAHHPREVYDLCQTVTVLRDGRHVLARSLGELTHDELMRAIAGDAEPDSLAASGDSPVREPMLSVAGLSIADRFEEVGLRIGRGEIVGVTGAVGSGKVSLAQAIAGVHRADSGTVTVDGTQLPPGDPAVAIAAGIGFLPRERSGQGLMPDLSLAENVTLPVAGQLAHRGFLKPGLIRTAGRQAIADFDIAARGPRRPAGRLPAGEAQKVLLARAMSSRPKVLVLVDPTSGVDTAARRSLLDSVKLAASKAAAVMLVSEDLDDLRVCDRLLVMFRGHVTAEVPRGWAEADVLAAIEGVAR